jgi:hypothetical protein
MKKSIEDEDAISLVMLFLKKSEYGSDDYYLGYKSLVKLLKEQADMRWEYASNDLTNKQEFLYLIILEMLINPDNANGLDSESPELISKIIKADNEFIEYCKAACGIENTYPFEVKFKIKDKLDIVRKALEYC